MVARRFQELLLALRHEPAPMVPKVTNALTLVSHRQTASAAGTFSRSRTNVGWTVGAGVEGAAFWAPNWTWKVEYLYMDLGTDNLNNINGTGLFVGNNIRFTDNIVRAGLNYRFGY